ncbi:MAG: atpH [Candidatus Saccharibacteria bacterium]|nr:atpH [Candidatus Saccharibacteria bacterium]
MALRLSRRKIATYTADQLLAGVSKRDVLRSVAAYLVDAKRTRELTLLVRDIEDVLAERGHIVADVASAHPLSETLKAEIKKLVGGSTPQLRELVESDLLGGVRVDVPGKRFDGTIRHKLTALRAKQL